MTPDINSSTDIGIGNNDVGLTARSRSTTRRRTSKHFAMDRSRNIGGNVTSSSDLSRRVALALNNLGLLQPRANMQHVVSAVDLAIGTR